MKLLKINTKATGETILNKCKEKNMTVVDLCDTLGLNRTTPYMWRLGRCYPQITTLLNLSRVLECSVEDLLVTEEVESEDNVEVLDQ